VSSHHHHPAVSEKRLGFSILLNLTITIAEFIGGLFSNSLALISDAVHNLSDTFSLILAFIAQRIGKKDYTPRQTFGYKRAEILSAFINAVILIVISIFLFYEAVLRFNHPEPVNSHVMFWVALIGLAANLISVVILQRDASGNLNIRSAYMHLIGDTLSSVVVILGALAIRFFGILWLDPVLTILIGIFILKETYRILAQATGILMESSPGDIDIEALRKELEKNPGIANIHHIHIWRISDHETHFQCHADLSDDLLISQSDRIRMDMEKIIIAHFPIHHVTIQMEFDTCKDKGTIAGKHEHF